MCKIEYSYSIIVCYFWERIFLRWRDCGFLDFYIKGYIGWDFDRFDVGDLLIFEVLFLEVLDLS